eukprot:GHVT01069120.1.p1 GENE.GHVT01069120.1~~GHVT01069120.1.p1  ORF type:complete len:147 (-),score=34.90 GHVT01069120.1:224-637(-)
MAEVTGGQQTPRRQGTIVAPAAQAATVEIFRTFQQEDHRGQERTAKKELSPQVNDALARQQGRNAHSQAKQKRRQRVTHKQNQLRQSTSKALKTTTQLPTPNQRRSLAASVHTLHSGVRTLESRTVSCTYSRMFPPK